MLLGVVILTLNNLRIIFIIGYIPPNGRPQLSSLPLVGGIFENRTDWPSEAARALQVSIVELGAERTLDGV